MESRSLSLSRFGMEIGAPGLIFWCECTRCVQILINGVRKRTVYTRPDNARFRQKFAIEHTTRQNIMMRPARFQNGRH